jgi:hypothetical protein
METVRIIAGCTVAAMLYGIAHDQITARVCPEYFTVFHPPIFRTQSPTLLGIGWGILASWPVGVGFGILFAIGARSGRRPKLALSQLTSLVLRLLAIMALSAVTLGTLGYFFGHMPVRESFLARMTPSIRAAIPVDSERRFVADWWAHIASYASGLLGGLICCIAIYLKRMRNRL